MIWAQSMGAPTPQALINGGVLSLFILALGGSKFAVGAAFTMNFFAQIIRTLMAPYVDVANKKRMVIIWFSTTVLFLGALLIAHPIQLAWGNKAAVWYVVIIFLGQRLCVNVGAAAWMPMLSDLIPESLRGRFFGRLRRNFQIVSFILILLIGWYLGTSPSITKFYLVFLVLFLMSAARPLLLLRLPETPPSKEGPREPIFRNIARPFQDSNFRAFLLFWASVAFTVNMARPFAVPFLKEDLAFPASITTYASAALILGMVIGLLPWGRVADRFGNRFVFLLNIVLMAGAFHVLASTPNYPSNSLMAMLVGILSFLLIGIAIGGLGIAHTVRQMYAAPSEHRGAYMGVFYTTNGLISGIVATGSGAVLEQLPESIQLMGTEMDPMRIFFPGAALCVLITLLLLARLEPLAERPIRHTVANFISLLPPTLTIPLRLINLDPHQHDR